MGKLVLILVSANLVLTSVPQAACRGRQGALIPKGSTSTEGLSKILRILVALSFALVIRYHMTIGVKSLNIGKHRTFKIGTGQSLLLLGNPRQVIWKSRLRLTDHGRLRELHSK
jgi:hypothetical protein